MADSTLSGYKASATTLGWSSGQALASLTNDETTDLTDAVDNSTNKYMFIDVEVVLGSASFTGADSVLVLYLVPSVDGTNYGDWSGDTTSPNQGNDNHEVDRKVTTGTTAAQRLLFRDVPVPNGLWKLGFRNLTNVTLASSGNTVKYRPHQYAG